MEQNYADETFLERWLNGELSAKELKDFEESEAFKDYKKILEGSDKFIMPKYNKKAAFTKIQQKVKVEPKLRKLIPNWVYAAAASVAILLGAYYYLILPTTVSTNFGQQLAVTLPDGSEVMLNAKSTIKYNERNWEKNRNINLEGEAFFKVKKGKTFKVVSNLGEVEVLGTQFNVSSNDLVFDVACLEGKVRVESNNSKVILTKGKAFRNSKNNIEEYTFNQQEPGWLQGESTFTSAPLLQVIRALEKQFNIKIEFENIDVNQRFTGSFIHTDVKLALKTVFLPMEISYTFKNENTVILVKG